MAPKDLESQLAHLYTVFSVTEDQKTEERLILFLLDQFLQLEPSAVWLPMFDPSPDQPPMVARAVAAARRKVPRPQPKPAIFIPLRSNQAQ
jgi:hypothetical protein